jgi:hypothetical protein
MRALSALIVSALAVVGAQRAVAQTAPSTPGSADQPTAQAPTRNRLSGGVLRSRRSRAR